MEERKDEISISSPEFFEGSAYMAILTHFYQDHLEEEMPQKVLGILASIELNIEHIPQDLFNFYCLYLYEAAANRIIINDDSNAPKKTPIPEFDPNDKACLDCRPLVDIALAQYAFLRSRGDQKHSISDYLGGIFSYSGVAVEGVDDGYHLKSVQVKKAYDLIASSYVATKEAEETFKKTLALKARSLKDLFEKYENGK